MIDTTSPTWREIDAVLRERLEAMRLQNDAVRPESETNVTRGRIAEIKELLRLPERQRGDAERRAAATAADVDAWKGGDF